MDGKRAEGAGNVNGVAPLVVVQTEDGFRVYSPTNPSSSYTVSGNSENPMCTCHEFRHGKNEYCTHIEAVLNSFGKQNGTTEADRYAAEERLAIQNESRAQADQ